MPDPEYRISVHPEDRMIEVVLRSPNGDKWEYGIPYNESGRFVFEDIKVIEMDFGSDFAERMLGDLRSAVSRSLETP